MPCWLPIRKADAHIQDYQRSSIPRPTVCRCSLGRARHRWFGRQSRSVLVHNRTIADVRILLLLTGLGLGLYWVFRLLTTEADWKKRSCSRCVPDLTSSVPVVSAETSTRLTKPCTQQAPFLKGAWSTCSHACLSMRERGGRALMESKELSKAELPHNSSKTCIKIVASSHWGAGQLCNEQVYPNGPLGMCRCMEIW